MNRKQFIEKTMRLTLLGGLTAASGYAVIKHKNNGGISECDLNIKCGECALAEECGVYGIDDMKH